MKRRLVVPGISLAGAGSTVELDDGDAHYLRDVLRLSAGAELSLFDGRGKKAEATIRSLGKRAATLELHSVVEIALPRPALELVQGVSKGDKMDLVVRQCTEIGVSAIQPVITARSVAERRARSDRWRSIARDAVRVSGRAFEPEVHEPIDLDLWLERPPAERRLFFSGDRATGLRELAPDLVGLSRIELVVGPEGGFDEREAARLIDSGATPVSLGAFTLRTETAGPVALALLMFLVGRLGGPTES